MPQAEAATHWPQVDHYRVRETMSRMGRRFEAERQAYVAQRNALVVSEGGHICGSMEIETKRPCDREAAHLFPFGWRCPKHSPAPPKRGPAPGGTTVREAKVYGPHDPTMGPRTVKIKGPHKNPFDEEHPIPGALVRQREVVNTLAHDHPLPPVTLPQAEARRDVQMGRVDRAADDAWKYQARQAIWHLAKSGRDFTTDDVWDLLETRQIPPPSEPRAIGPLIMRALRAKVIADTGRMAKSRRRHATKITIYVRGEKA